MGSVADGVRKKTLMIIANWLLGTGDTGHGHRHRPRATAHGLGGAWPGGRGAAAGGDPTQSAEARRVTEW